MLVFPYPLAVRIVPLVCYAAMSLFAFSVSADDSLPSFRMLSAGNGETNGSASIEEPAVWLSGTIDGEESRQQADPHGIAGIYAAPADSVEQIPSHSSFDTTQLMTYDEPTIGLDETADVIADRAAEPRQMRGMDRLSGEPRPWLTWKSTSVVATVAPGSGDDFGITDLNIRGKIGFKLPFISVSPGYQATYLNGPDVTDIPGTLHQVSVTVMGMVPLSQRFMGQVMVSPTIATDFQNTGSDSFRSMGMGLVIFMQSPELQWIFGVVYLDREDISLLPAVGLTWTPNERNKFNFSFPRPRYSRLISKQGERERWWYLSAEFGGGSWAIERTNGDDDVVTLRDYRLSTGMEYKREEKRSWFWEAGLVIGRRVEYNSGIGDYNQEPTGFVRSGITF